MYIIIVPDKMYFIIVPDIPTADHDEDDVKKKMEVVVGSSGVRNDFMQGVALFGLGWKNPETFDENYYKSLNLNPIPSDWVLFFIKIVEVVERNPKLRYIAGLSMDWSIHRIIFFVQQSNGLIFYVIHELFSALYSYRAYALRWV